MKLVIGLGNPGEKYKRTKHNIGWLVLDYILRDFQTSSCSKFDAYICEGIINGEKTLFVYPQTFMNESGRAVKQILDFYKLTAADIIVLHDEVDIPLGTIKFTDSSGSAGHNGIKSLIDNLGTQNFKRIRIGVETRLDKTQPPTDVFVLSPFNDQELAKIPFKQIEDLVLQQIQKV